MVLEIRGAAAGVASVPAVLFDGENEISIGNVVVYETLDFKRFLAVLSQKIGVSPHQFAAYVSSPEADRRIPITGKSNFAAILRLKSCLIVVVLKRSRRERRRRSPKAGDLGEKNPPRNVVILRRSGENLELERERYVRSLLSGRVACEECLRAEDSGRVAEFHCCVNDMFVFGFRSRAGPVTRPH